MATSTLELSWKHAATATFYLDELLMLSTQTLFFAFGWMFSRKKLFQDDDIKPILPHAIFAITFVLSCTFLN
jgi:hypothetical protein